MLYEFGFYNYFSFKEGASVSFRKLGDDIKEPSEVYPIIGIKGANASGKTHLIKALNFLVNFCLHSFSNEPESKINIKPFFDSEESTFFYIEFNVNGINYLYECRLSEENVLNEKFSLLSDGSIIFERTENNVIFSDNSPELNLIKFRKNVSVLSTLKQYELELQNTHIQNASLFFSKIITNVNAFGFSQVNMSVESVSEIYNDNPELFSLVKDIIIKNDLGIIDIEIHQIKENEKTVYFPVFIHYYTKNGETQKRHLLQYYESSGTIRLYTELLKYFIVLSDGGILALDEFDKNLHSLVLPHLLNLFNNENAKHAQFLFTAHNTEIIDYLGKHQTILVEKQMNESFCYRLDEIEGNMLVDGRPISSLYLSGRLGGIPNL